ncbi:SdpI family protein [Microbacterium hibisci]|uniref:SdpI family protein n=1 Tax=Microbacterium hibisci TaxID=2036000 RepID=UPI001942C546|nr:SdpI family protein [Microbacterium hibisci]
MPDSLAMSAAILVTAVVLVGAGALMLWLARRGADGTLARNQLVGVRTALTLSSDAAWHAGQRAAAPRITVAGWGAIGGGVALVVLALVALPFQVAMTAYCLLAFGSAAWLLAWVVAAAAPAQRAARAAVA